jgi:glycosyltransferase involved in cell wall biosynthesis
MIQPEGDGPSASVPALCESLSAAGADVELSCVGKARPLNGVRVDARKPWPFPARFGVSISHMIAMGDQARRADIVHTHSLWSMTTVAAGWRIPGKRAKLVASPRGTLSPTALSYAPVAKRLVRPWQRRLLTHADLIHATSPQEVLDIRAAGFTAPVALVPNGVDVPATCGPRPADGPRTLLFLGRIHPIKGVDALLRAWRALQDRHREWQLVVAGPGRPRDMASITALARSLRLERVSFPGALFGDSKRRAFEAADLFILPSRSESFGLAIAEALAHGCPVVAGRGTPWQGLITERCGWWSATEVESLASTLDEALSVPREELAAMGARGWAWMRRDFTWPAIASRMMQVYSWLMDGGTPPPDVHPNPHA